MNSEKILSWKLILYLLALFLLLATDKALCEEVAFQYSISKDKISFRLPFSVLHSGNTVNELTLPFHEDRAGFSIDTNGRLKRGRIRMKVDSEVVLSDRKTSLILDYIVLQPRGAEAYFSLALEPLYIDTRIRLRAGLSPLDKLLLEPLSYPNLSSDFSGIEVHIDRLSFYLDDTTLGIKDIIGTVRAADKEFRITAGHLFLSSKGAGFVFELGPGSGSYRQKLEDKFIILNENTQDSWTLLSERLVFDASRSFSPGKRRPEHLGFFAYRPCIRVKIAHETREAPYMWFLGQKNWYGLNESLALERNFRGRLEKDYTFHLSSPRDLQIVVHRGSYLEFCKDRGPLFDTAFIKSIVVFPSQFSSPSGRLSFDATGQLDASLRGNIKVSFGRPVGLSLRFRDRHLHLRLDKLKLSVDLSKDYLVSVRQAELSIPYISDIKLNLRDFRILDKSGISFSLNEEFSGMRAKLYGLNMAPDRFVLNVSKGNILSMSLSGLSSMDNLSLSDVRFFWTIYAPYQLSLFPSDSLAVRNLSLLPDTALYFRGGYVYGGEDKTARLRLIFDLSLMWFDPPVSLKGISIEIPIDRENKEIDLPVDLPVRFYGMDGQLKTVSFRFLDKGVLPGCSAIFTPSVGQYHFPLELLFSGSASDGIDLTGTLNLHLSGFKMEAEVSSVDSPSRNTLNLSGIASVFLFDSFTPVKANFSLQVMQNRVEKFSVLWNNRDEFPFVSSLVIRNMQGRLWLDRDKSGPLMKINVSGDFSDVRGGLADFAGVIEASMDGDREWGGFSINGKMILFPQTEFALKDIDFSGAFSLRQAGVALALKGYVEKDLYNFWDLFYIKGGFDLSIEADNVDGLRCRLGSKKPGFYAFLFKGFPARGYLDLFPDKDRIKGRLSLTSDISGPIYSSDGNSAWSYGIEPYRQLSCQADIYLSDTGHILCRYSDSMVFGASAYGMGFLALGKGDISLSSPNPWQFGVNLSLEKDLEWDSYAPSFELDLLDREVR